MRKVVKEFPGLYLKEDCNKGWSLFTNKPIKNNTRLIEYQGVRMDSKMWSLKEKLYRDEGLTTNYSEVLSNGKGVIDACKKGNKARFINSSHNPNCAAFEVS